MKLICILALLTTVNCSSLRSKKPNNPTPPIIIPKYILETNHKSLNQMRIATPEFCAKQVLKPGHKYQVLPWWYDYCHELSVRKEIDAGKVRHFLPEHSKVLKRIRAYNKKKEAIYKIMNS